MDERLRCVARLLEGEKKAPLCREFGILRKTGYKIATIWCGIAVGGGGRMSGTALSRADVRWLRLSIQIERISPGTHSRTAVMNACTRR